MTIKFKAKVKQSGLDDTIFLGGEGAAFNSEDPDFVSRTDGRGDETAGGRGARESAPRTSACGTRGDVTGGRGRRGRTGAYRRHDRKIINGTTRFAELDECLDQRKPSHVSLTLVFVGLNVELKPRFTARRGQRASRSRGKRSWLRAQLPRSRSL